MEQKNSETQNGFTAGYPSSLFSRKRRSKLATSFGKAGWAETRAKSLKRRLPISPNPTKGPKSFYVPENKALPYAAFL